MRKLRNLTSFVSATLISASVAVSSAQGAPARTLPVPREARQAVDVALVIATDVSPSIDAQEAHLQREGIAEAFLNQQVVQAVIFLAGVLVPMVH